MLHTESNWKLKWFNYLVNYYGAQVIIFGKQKLKIFFINFPNKLNWNCIKIGAHTRDNC